MGGQVEGSGARKLRVTTSDAHKSDTLSFLRPRLNLVLCCQILNSHVTYLSDFTVSIRPPSR